MVHMRIGSLWQRTAANASTNQHAFKTIERTVCVDEIVSIIVPTQRRIGAACMQYVEELVRTGESALTFLFSGRALSYERLHRCNRWLCDRSCG